MAALVIVVAATVTIRGAPTLDVSVGLGGRVVPGRPAAVRLAIADPLSEVARLRIVEGVGAPGRERAVLSIEAQADVTEHVLPIATGWATLRVELLSADGRALATRDVDLTAAGEATPFSVWVGTFSAPRVDRAVAVRADDLPNHAASFAAAHTVWIGRPRDRIDARRWDAIAGWVLSGGSLVVFTGADAFLLDAPRWRDLLPITDLELTEAAGGTRMLAGTLRPSAEVLRWKDGAPWIIAGRYGIGSVLLVCTDAHSLDQETVGEIAALAPPARAPQLEQAAAEFLDRQPVDLPDPLAALALTVLGAAAIPAIALRRRPRPAAPLVAIAAFGLLALASALYTRPPRAGYELYQTHVQLSIFGSIGTSMTWSAAFSASTEPEVALLWMGHAPSESTRRGYGSMSAVAYSPDGEARIVLAPGERRLLAARAPSSTGLGAAMAGDETMRLTNRLGRRIEDALVLIDGKAFAVPAIDPGETSIVLSSAGTAPRQLGARGGPVDVLLAEVARGGALDRGVWLIAGDVVDERRLGEGGRTSLRSIRLYVVEVGHD